MDAMDAIAASDARAAQAMSLHRLAEWALNRHSYYWGYEPSYDSCAWLGATTDAVRAWAGPLFEAFVSGVWALYWTDDTLYWIAKPKVRVDVRRRLHREDGPALESDIEPLYFIEGVLVTEQIVMHPETITSDDVEAEENAEAQRIMIERMGADRYMRESGATVIDMDSLALVGSAPRALMQDKKGNRWLVGTDGSTARVYLMAVPRNSKTCAEAHCAISGLDSEARLIAEA